MNGINLFSISQMDISHYLCEVERAEPGSADFISPKVERPAVMFPKCFTPFKIIEDGIRATSSKDFLSQLHWRAEGVELR